MRKRELNGYFTIEAAVITTIVLCILIFLIYLSFFIYDRALLTGVAYEAALEGSRMYDKTGDEIKEVVEELVDDYVENRLLACSYETEVSVDLFQVSVTYHLHVRAPFEGLMEKWVKGFSADYTVTKKSTRISGVTFIQTCQNIEFLRNKFASGEE